MAIYDDKQRQGTTAQVVGRLNGGIIGFTFIFCVVALLFGNTDKAITYLAIGAFLLAIGLAAYWLANLSTIQTGSESPRAAALESLAVDYESFAGEAALTGHQDTASLGKAYDQAGREVMTGSYQPAVWAWALAKMGGDEKAAQAAYIQGRVRQLQAASAQEVQRLNESRREREQVAAARQSAEKAKEQAKEQAEAKRLQNSWSYKFGQMVAGWLSRR